MRPNLHAPRAHLAALLLGALLLLALLPAPAGVFAEDEEGGKEDAKPAAAAERKPILPQIQENPRDFKDLVEAARQYFDLDEEHWKGRKNFVAALEAQAAEGRFFLKDMEALRWLVYQGRSFDPQLTNRKWQKSVGITESKGLGGTLEWIRSDDLTITFSVPRKYWKERDFRSKYPRIDPYPLLLTMHDKRDYTGQSYPGEVLLERRYDKRDWDALYDEWIILCPVVAAGNYLNEDGRVRNDAFREPFADFWRHYHIDFDRVILDGSEQAFPAVAAMPILFAGVVFQHGDDGRWKLETDKQKAVVPNFASVPVYVVDNPELAQQLRDAGHPDVTAGVGGATLMTWMAERRRVIPTTFTWIPEKIDQVLAHWINLDSPNWNAAKRELKVAVDKEANRIAIEAVGINDLSLFLNDEIVDLDRKVQVTINKNIEFDGVIQLQNERMSTLGRDFDFIFNREPVRIRQSMYFGFMMPTRIVRLPVRPPPKPAPKDDAKEAGKDEPQASPEEEEAAAKLLYKARIFAERGNKEQAREFCNKVLALPRNKSTDEAKSLLEKLK